MMRIFSIISFVLVFNLMNAQVIEHTIYFDSGRSDIKPGENKWFDSVAAIISGVNYSIQIWAYCDADGSELSNLDLARKRGETARELFTGRLKNDQFMTLHVIGEGEPVGDNNTSAGKAANRRIKISVGYETVPHVENPVKEVKAPEEKKPDVPKKETDNNLASAKLEVGKTLILKNLNFEGGTPILLPQSEPVLKELLKLMQDNPKLEIEIGGHVCCGPDYELSVQRAKKVYNYLKGYGIDVKRMSYKGYSFDKPIASERTEAGKAANRRVEIRILKL